MAQHGKNENFTRGILHGVGWMYVSSIIQGVSRVLVLAIMTRLLEPTDFGLMGIALIFTSFAERLGQLGVGIAVVQREHLDDEDLRAGSYLSILSGAIIFILLSLFAPLIAEFFDAPAVESIIPVLAISFVVDGMSMMSDSMLQRHLKFRQLMTAENISYLVGNLIVGCGLAWIGFGVWALVIATVGTRIIRAVLLLRLEPQPLVFRYRTKGRIGSLLNVGVGFSLGRILSFLSLQGDNFVVGRMLGVQSLGMYTRGYQLMTLPATYLGQVLEKVLFPAMAKKQRDSAKLGAMFLTALEVVTIASLPMSVWMYFLSPEIITVLFGAKWSALIPVLEILSLGVFFRTAYKCSDTVIRATGAVYRIALRQLVYTAGIVGGSVIGGHLAGLEGVAVAVVLSVAMNYFLMTRLSGTVLGISARQCLGAHLPGIWISAAVGLAAWGTSPFLRDEISNSLVRLIVSVAIGGVTGLIALLAAPPLCRPSYLARVVERFPLRKLGILGDGLRRLVGARTMPVAGLADGSSGS